MKIRVVSDSSSNLFRVDGFDYITVPMKILAGQTEYVDKPGISTRQMVDDLKVFKGKSGSSCPNAGEWLEAFEGADAIFAITISKNCSGSYNAAASAAREYMEENPGSKVFVVDSLTAGPGMAMIAEKLRELISQGLEFEQIKERILDYQNHTHTVFSLKSVNNLVHNGRVSHVAGKIVAALNMRVIGYAKGGKLEMAHKPRGDKKAVETILRMMEERGFYDGALVRISQCFQEEIAGVLKEQICAKYPASPVIIEPTTALCSYYAEEGGLIVGFEGAFNTENDNHLF